MKDIILKLPSGTIREILRRVPRAQLQELQKELKEEKVISVPAEHLLRLAGIVSIGGDAVKDTERVWGE